MLAIRRLDISINKVRRHVGRRHPVRSNPTRLCNRLEKIMPCSSGVRVSTCLHLVPQQEGDAATQPHGDSLKSIKNQKQQDARQVASPVNRGLNSSVFQ